MWLGLVQAALWASPPEWRPVLGGDMHCTVDTLASVRIADLEGWEPRQTHHTLENAWGTALEFVADEALNVYVYDGERRRLNKLRGTRIVAADTVSPAPLNALGYHRGRLYVFDGSALHQYDTAALVLRTTMRLESLQSHPMHVGGVSRFVGRFLVIGDPYYSVHDGRMEDSEYRFVYIYDFVTLRLSPKLDRSGGRSPFVDCRACDEKALGDFFYHTGATQLGDTVAELVSESQRYIVYLLEPHIVDALAERVPWFRHFYLFDKWANTSKWIVDLENYRTTARTYTALVRFVDEKSLVFVHIPEGRGTAYFCRLRMRAE